MSAVCLPTVYRNYIACLNAQDWATLSNFVSGDVYYNDKYIGLLGYRSMLERDYREIPDLYFSVSLLVGECNFIAARLTFSCTPIGSFQGLSVNGRTVHFTENVFYEFLDAKISRVWSVIDKAAIEAQL
ncbi:ester cyclase [Pseudomonas yamanorum]|uniref:ester cyclase n=1 Tax=Pseudomonas yamanorum TaxID=515393 RepID=UPI003D36677B